MRGRVGSLVSFAVVAGTLAACNDSTSSGEPPPPPPDSSAQIVLTPVATGLSSPLYLTAPAGDARLFVVEKTGAIRIVKDGVLLPTPFLDLSDAVSAGSEQGLLSMAFHPDYATNGFFYVDYTDVDGNTQVVRYSVSTADPDVADPASAKPLLSVEQPFANHNGGLLLFGPDGKLYIGLGDGGSGGDPFGNGQSLGTLLGKILRIDVDAGDPYAVPADNPFVGSAGARGEIWAYGLRNPWRFAFDPKSDRLYIADVGQGAWEEVDVVPADAGGENFGWNIMEGTQCFNASSCSRNGLTLPVLEYSHADGCSITGGFVYRGSLAPDVVGQYFYSDFCAGFLRSFTFDGTSATQSITWEVGDIGNVQSFGEDAAGELYILSTNGTVYRVGEK
ncbi:MAG TPA: PQQ-dependent sugar dehydrogenase [Gemmatimonadaceae bacterium]|nr:PQQ-dependent sugar dehydrogenase [Gemmatimonadaceae bacterium]